jgi:aryl-alcohol dehydrogenase
MKIEAAVIRESGKPFRIEEVDLAAPKAGEILVKVVASGVCRTDDAARKGVMGVPLPAVFGHEGAGIVEELGAGVTEFAIGDHVALSFGFCGTCDNCLSAHQHACENNHAINFSGVMKDGTSRLSLDGQELSCFFGQSSFATYAVADAASAVKIAKDIDLAIAAPLGCGVQTGAGAVLNCMQPEFGSSIAVFGCGTVGMSAIMAARIAGCKHIVAVGGNPRSLQLALEIGATDTVNRKEIDDVTGEIKRLTGGGMHYTFETSGYDAFLHSALDSLRTLGTAVVVGGSSDLTLSLHADLIGPAKTIKGLIEGNSIPKLFIPKLLDYYKQGRFPVDRLIERYDFKDIDRALEDSGSGKVIKAVLEM